MQGLLRQLPAKLRGQQLTAPVRRAPGARLRAGALALFGGALALSCGAPHHPEAPDKAGPPRPAHPALSAAGRPRLSLGASHGCLRVEGGKVVCWGDNGSGQLGARAGGAAAPVAGLDGAVEVSAGSQHTCALLSDGTVQCWGSNAFGQLGDGGHADRSAPAAVTGLQGVERLSAGSFHTCAFDRDAGLVCWGGDLGKLSVEEAPETGWRQTPFPLVRASQEAPRWLSSGHERSCLVGDNAEVQCWDMGLTRHRPQRAPEPIEGLRAARAVSVGWEFACAIDLVRSAHCWGADTAGKTPPSRRKLSRVVEIEQVTQVCVGTRHACALQSDGLVACWGSHDDGRTGAPAGSPPGVHLLDKVDEVVEVGCGHAFSCALRRSGEVRCWGRDEHGEVSGAPR